MAKSKKGSSGKSATGGKKKGGAKDTSVKPPVDTPVGGKVEAHLAYLVKVLTQGSLYHIANEATKDPVSQVAFLMAQAVIKDLQVAAKTLGEAHFEALGAVAMPYLDSLAKAGGGDGGSNDPEILQGP
ncbi:MAG: hypothetical protein JNK48_07820 [Bryobacterales bacterium]|nr:hypothetical protein [Bryobacterales bacterium]